MSPLVIFGVAAIATYCLRIALIVGEEKLAGMQWLHQAVTLVSPAVLAAIVASNVLVSNGELAMPSLVVVVVVASGAYGVHRTGNVAVALATGLPVYWLAAAAGLA